MVLSAFLGVMESANLENVQVEIWGCGTKCTWPFPSVHNISLGHETGLKIVRLKI